MKRVLLVELVFIIITCPFCEIYGRVCPWSGVMEGHVVCIRTHGCNSSSFAHVGRSACVGRGSPVPCRGFALASRSSPA